MFDVNMCGRKYKINLDNLTYSGPSKRRKILRKSREESAYAIVTRTGLDNEAPVIDASIVRLISTITEVLMVDFQKKDLCCS